jgi:hypothetical protein
MNIQVKSYIHIENYILEKYMAKWDFYIRSEYISYLTIFVLKNNSS